MKNDAFVDEYLWEVGYLRENGYFYIHNIFYYNSLTSDLYYPAADAMIVPEKMIINITPELRQRVLNNINEFRNQQSKILKRDENPQVQYTFYLQNQLLPPNISV